MNIILICAVCALILTVIVVAIIKTVQSNKLNKIRRQKIENGEIGVLPPQFANAVPNAWMYTPVAYGTAKPSEQQTAATTAESQQKPAEEKQSRRTMKERDMSVVVRRGKAMQKLSKVLVYLFLGVMAILVLFPFYWMIISSLKDYTEYTLTIPTFWPKVIHFENYVTAFQTAKLGRLFLNTVIVGVVSTLLSLVITILSAFAFARLDFKGKNILFAGLLGTMMIPGELFTITNYVTVSNWEWMHSYKVLIIPFLVSVFYIYLLRQNFMQIPDELYYAAKVDGTSDIKYLIKVMIPLALPTIISITILKMMGSWNSYVWPRLVANDDAHKLVTNGLRGTGFYVDGDTSKINYPIQMAAVALVSAPLFLVFVFLRKYIIKGVSRSGIKG